MLKTIVSVVVPLLLVCASSCKTCGNPQHKAGLRISPNAGFLKLEDYPKQKALVFTFDIDSGRCKIRRVQAWLVDGDPCAPDASASSKPFLDRTPDARGKFTFSKPDDYEATLAEIGEHPNLLVRVICEHPDGSPSTYDFSGNVDEWGCAQLKECR